jgi:hypothetical protein
MRRLRRSYAADGSLIGFWHGWYAPACAGVMAPDELQKFVEAAGNKLIVVDARNPDFNTEPGNKFSKGLYIVSFEW